MKRGMNDASEEDREEEKEAEVPGYGAKEKPSDGRKRGGHVDGHMRHKRARGGKLDAAHEHKMHGHGAEHGKIHRKKGGRIMGEMPKHRPDRRARGGATSELNPTTAAGNVSKPDYESKQGPSQGHAKGHDRD